MPSSLCKLLKCKPIYVDNWAVNKSLKMYRRNHCKISVYLIVEMFFFFLTNHDKIINCTRIGSNDLFPTF